MIKNAHDAFQRIDGSVIFNSGQVIARVHGPDKCHGDVCPIHKPTNHKLRGEQLYYNGKHMVRRVGDKLMIDPDDFFYRQNGEAILRNSAVCGKCGDEIESKSRHDFVMCSCQAISVDGGLEYLRSSADSLDNFINTSVVVKAGDDE